MYLLLIRVWTKKYCITFRKDVNCFGDDTCYSLAFGVPAILMGVATVILVIGNYTCGGYVHKPPQGSVFAQVFGSIWVSWSLSSRWWKFKVCCSDFDFEDPLL